MKYILETVWQDSFSSVCYDLLPKDNSINPECSNIYKVDGNNYVKAMSGQIDFFIDGYTNLNWYIEFCINRSKKVFE